MIVAVPSFSIPPPAKAELPESVLPVTVNVPELSIPPPLASAWEEAVLSERVLPVTVSVPELKMPHRRPRSRLPSCPRGCSSRRSACHCCRCRHLTPADPSEMVMFESVTVAVSGTSNTWTELLPLTVTRFAPGPLITSGPDGSFSSSVLVRVIVCGGRKPSARNRSRCRRGFRWHWPE